MEPLSFRPKARLGKQIGRDLITDEVVAVFELVKNSYDADATEVRISLLNVTKAGGCIEIADNGHGMSYTDLRDKWMEPATDDKEKHRLSPGGRAVLGNKGIGRFAVDKLGKRLHLACKKTGDPAWIHVQFDWDQFTADRYLDELKSQPWTEAAEPDEHGVLLRMEPVRNRWTEAKIRALLLHLQTLVPPAESGADFRIMVECSDLPELSGPIEPLEPEGATAAVEVEVGADGTVTRQFGARTEVVIADLPVCGPVRIKLWYFEPEARGKWATRTRVPWEEWAGVRIYRDGFRVLPYGRPKNDWLGLGERRSKKVGGKLANRDVMGVVQITREANPDLEDTTSRESMKGEPAFEALKTLVMREIEFLEAQLNAEKAIRVQPAPQPASTPANVGAAASQGPTIQVGPKSDGASKPVPGPNPPVGSNSPTSANDGTKSTSGSIWTWAKAVGSVLAGTHSTSGATPGSTAVPGGAHPDQVTPPLRDRIAKALQTVEQAKALAVEAGRADLATELEQVVALLVEFKAR